jgi:polygalacturonase
MELKILTLTCLSITVEICNEAPYYTPEPYRVIINRELVLADGRCNVFSLYDLKPDTAYKLEVKTETAALLLEFRTLPLTYVLNVRNFNAQGDGVHDDTLAVQTAIMACPEGGLVYFPEGTYLVRSIFLKSNLQVYLKKGATLLASAERADYAILPGTIRNQTGELILGTWEGNPLPIYTSLITGINVQNIRFFGEGTMDGNAQNGPWWINPKKKVLAYRPRGIFLNNCREICFQGLTVQNTPSWAIHPYYCDNLEFYDLKIKNPSHIGNTDGLNPESCRNVKIIGLHFSVGDDCIAIKSGKIYMAKHHRRPTSNLEIRNCLMEDGHGAIVLGSEISGGASDIRVSQCIFSRTDRGLRIKTRRGRGDQPITDITFKNILMQQVKNAFVINMFYFCDPDGKSEYVWSKKNLPVDERTPKLGKFCIQDITCLDTSISAGFFYGLPEAPIAELCFERVKVTYGENEEFGKPAMMSFIPDYSKLGFYFHNVNKVHLNNVQISGQKGEAFQFENVQEITNK